MSIPEVREIFNYIFNFIFSFIALIIVAPVIIIAALIIYKEDRSSPFYLAKRIGKGGRAYIMYKLRSMIANAEKSGVDSTKSNDERLTSIGKIVRKFKIDELPQFVNVLLGQMSIVGPRPNVEREVLKYTDTEKKLLSVTPGITDLSSITFSDLNNFLDDKGDANLAYEGYIRPWKSRLGLFYVEHKSIVLDLLIIILTVLNFVSRRMTLSCLNGVLISLECDEELRLVACRKKEPYVSTPP